MFYVFVGVLDCVEGVCLGFLVSFWCCVFCGLDLMLSDWERVVLFEFFWWVCLILDFMFCGVVVSVECR